MKNTLFTIIIMLALVACKERKQLDATVFETSANGNQLTIIYDFSEENTATDSITLRPETKYQEIVGFGGAFTEASAHLLNKLSTEKRAQIIQAYFSEDGANYSLTRTHINSCDFSLSNYSYAPIEGDTLLENFDISPDRDDIIPMIKEAQKASKEGFKIISSPWTAPPWMKDNNKWTAGSLLPDFWNTWALYFSKYITEYKKEGIDIWGITVENEPLGNGGQWESMHFTPEQMVDFTNNFLGPKLESDGHDVKIYGYDQNRDHLGDWVETMFKDEASSKYFYGTAVHWYSSTVDWLPEALQHAHEVAPDKHLLHSEACVDAEVPHWQDDQWYWSKEATDWGYDWAPEEHKKDHPKYVPVYRYARDIIGTLNNWVEGWIDWNMVLDRQGGPNWAKNWCNAPVIVDPSADEVYYTPLYYTMAHFSKFIRPGAVRIGYELNNEELMATAVENPDGTFALVILNMGETPRNIVITMEGVSKTIRIDGQALQTVLIKAHTK